MLGFIYCLIVVGVGVFFGGYAMLGAAIALFVPYSAAVHARRDMHQPVSEASTPRAQAIEDESRNRAERDRAALQSAMARVKHGLDHP